MTRKHCPTCGGKGEVVDPRFAPQKEVCQNCRGERWIGDSDLSAIHKIFLPNRPITDSEKRSILEYLSDKEGDE